MMAGDNWSNPNSDPMQDIIDAKAHLDRLAEEENWERDLWVSRKLKDYCENTPEGQEVLRQAELISGYKLNLRSPDELGILSWRDTIVRSQIFKPMPVTILPGGRIE